jgi:hypothetical protein
MRDVDVDAGATIVSLIDELQKSLPLDEGSQVIHVVCGHGGGVLLGRDVCEERNDLLAQWIG